jgi:hypothetical protein
MKKLRFLSAALLSASMICLLTACPSATGEIGPKGDKGDTGAQGPAGVQGPAGPAGQNGNANVIQISYGARTWANTVGALITLNLTGVNASVASNSAYFTYIQLDNLWYAVPGEISSYGEFRTYLSPQATSTVVIRRVTTGIALNATAVRVIIIPASDLRNGRKAAIDYSNYEEVKKAYNLPD